MKKLLALVVVAVVLQGCCMFETSAVPEKITNAIKTWEVNTQSLHGEWKRAVKTPGELPEGVQSMADHLEHQELLWTTTEKLAESLRLWAEENQN